MRFCICRLQPEKKTTALRNFARTWPVALLLLISGIIEVKLNPFLTNTDFSSGKKEVIKESSSIFQTKKTLAERGFDPRTSGLWAQHASTAPLCLLLRVHQHIARVKLVQIVLEKLFLNVCFAFWLGYRLSR